MRNFFRFVSAIVAVVLPISVGACDGDDAGAEDGIAPLQAELSSPGAFPVGFREAELTYIAPAGGGERTLPYKIWYPAVDGGEDPALYAVGGIIELPGVGRALDGPAPAEGRFPLAVYSHGSGGENLVGYPFAELFASHGWVVVAPNHVGNTAVDQLGGAVDLFSRIVLNRVADVTAQLDAVEAWEGDLAGLARTDRVFLFGHSFGGYTTFAGAGVDLDVDALRARCTPDDDLEVDDCDLFEDQSFVAALGGDLGDPRIVAIAPQAPALVPQYKSGELAALDIPTMVQSGRNDVTLPDATFAQPAWAGLDHPDDIWVEMPTGAHYTFITICDDLEEELLLTIRPDAPDDGCGPEAVPTSRAVPVLGAYLLGFARLHVLGETQFEALLRGPALDPDFVITTR